MKGYYPETRLDKAVKLWIADDKLRARNPKKWKIIQDQKKKETDAAWARVFSGQDKVRG